MNTRFRAIVRSTKTRTLGVDYTVIVIAEDQAGNSLALRADYAQTLDEAIQISHNYLRQLGAIQAVTK